MPTVFQMEAAECGAASLAMVLAYHGRWVSLEALRLQCGVSRDGSKASNIVKAARCHGLTARGLQREPDQLAGLPLPAILHWNFNHFLVLERIAGDHAYLNDPAQGPRTVRLEELNEAFTGVVLVFKPGADFQPTGTPPSTLAFLAQQITSAPAALSMVALASLLLILPRLAVPVFARVFVDGVLINHLNSWFTPLLVAMVLCATSTMLIAALQRHHLVRVQAALAVVMTGRLIWRILQLPMVFFALRHAGEVASRIDVTERLTRLVSGELATHAADLVSALAFSLVMLTIDPLLTAIGVGLTLINVAIVVAVSRHREDLSRLASLERGKLNAATVGAISMIETIKASGLEGEAFTRWAGHHARLLDAEQRLGLYDGFVCRLPELAAALTTAAILGVGGMRVMSGELTIGTLIAFLAMMAGFTGPIGALVQLAGNIPLIKGDIARLRDLLAPPLPSAPALVPAQPVIADALRGTLSFEAVSFGYCPLDPPLLENLSFRLEPGQRVALVGRSGSGKSTAAKLAAGLLEPWSGQVLLDGRPLFDYSREQRAAAIAYVDQDVLLFGGRIRDNLTLWDDTIPEHTLTRALKDARIHEDLAHRFGSYDGLLSEGGSNLSGGQRQRLEIARALACEPRLMILDEAMAALDPVNETLIDDALRRRGCSCLVVAHRLSTIRDSDEIIVLERGQVIERGRHAELLARQGAYWRLIEEA